MTSPSVSIATAVVEHYQRVSTYLTPPAIKALHVPPLQGDRRNVFCVLELEDGTPGLAYVALEKVHDRLGLDAQRYIQRGDAPASVLAGLTHNDGVRRALGLAAANAYARWLYDRAGFVPPEDTTALAGFDVGAGERVGMVGLFVPLLDRVTSLGAELSVLELNPELVGDFGSYRVSLDAAVLGECETVLCTSSVLLSGGFEQIRAACPKAQRFAVLGPGAGLLPEPLFACGVDTLGGSWVINAAAVIDAVREGESWSRHVRKTVLRRGQCPNSLELARRLAQG